jgi:hypothetical protein
MEEKRISLFDASIGDEIESPLDEIRNVSIEYH